MGSLASKIIFELILRACNGIEENRHSNPTVDLDYMYSLHVQSPVEVSHLNNCNNFTTKVVTSTSKVTTTYQEYDIEPAMIKTELQVSQHSADDRP